MILRKFLDPKHCVFNDGSIQLGTLHTYRKADDPEIQDGEEGLYRYLIDIPEGTIVEASLINALHPGISLIQKARRPLAVNGRFNVNVDEIRMSHVSKGFYRVGKYKVLVEFEASNTFMFCMSADLDRNSSPFEGKKHSWCFNHRDHAQFFDIVSEKMWETIPLDSFESSADFKDIHTAEINIIYKARPIKYVPQNSHDIMKITPTTATELEEILNNVAFIKQCQHRKQSEFRFIFNYYCHNRPLIPSPGYTSLIFDNVPAFIDH